MDASFYREIGGRDNDEDAYYLEFPFFPLEYSSCSFRPMWFETLCDKGRRGHRRPRLVL